MIKNVLIPESIGGYYLFAKRIVGFYIDDSSVSATQLYLSGHKTTIEQVFHESVEQGEGASKEERVAQVVANILGRVGKYDAVRTAMPSSQIIFKTLKLPFLKYEKIKMVVNFEVEPLLPFAVDQAVIDFIITKQFIKEGSSEIIVAAVQKAVVAEHFSFFEAVQEGPEKIGVDLFGLYGLYKRIPSYAEIEGGVALVDSGVHSTRVAFIHDGQLKAVRVLPKGVEDFVASVSTVINRSHDEVREEIFSIGLTKKDDQPYYEALAQELKVFWASVQFTLGSFASREGQQSVARFILSGSGTQIPGINEFVTEQTGVACEHFNIAQLFTDKQIAIKKTRVLSAADVMSLGAAFPSPITQNFNLLPLDVSAERDTTILTNQLIVAILFFLTIFASILVHSFLQFRSLRQELDESREEVVEVLKKRFDIPRDEEDFDDVVENAERAVVKEENVWFPFSAQSQFLKYLVELFLLDQEGLGLEVERISIAKGVMTLKARVKDYDSVIALEKELRKSKLFKYEGSVQKTDFTMKIGLNRNG